MLPPLRPNEQLLPAVAQAMGSELKARYEAGHSVRTLAADTGYSIQRIRSLLDKAETIMRPRGRNAQA